MMEKGEPMPTTADPEAERQTLAVLVNEVAALRRLVEARAHQTWERNGRPADTHARDWEEAEAGLKRELAHRFAAVEAQMSGWERGRRHREAEHAVTRALAASGSLDDAALGCLCEVGAAL